MPKEFPLFRYIKNRRFHKLRFVNKANKRRLTAKQRGEDNDYQYYTNRKICATLRLQRFDHKNLKYVVVEKRVTIPPLFLTDGCTGPCIENIDELDWIVHDWLYSHHKTDDGTAITYSEANSIFKKRHRRLISQLFGYYSWKWSGRRGPEFYNPSPVEIEDLKRTVSKRCTLVETEREE